MGALRDEQPPSVRVVGRYALYGAIASGGMATVHLGRLLGPVGFSRTVAIKRLHAQYAQDPEFVSMFLDEARLAARIRHPNVVPTLDVVATKGELFLVMDYVPGEALARLSRLMRERRQRMPQRLVSAIMSQVLHGLHAAHEAKSERGGPLGIVHRDVSPQNVLVGTDGVARVLDFGVAKAAGRTQQTREGQIKGKLSYMAPEQLRGAPVSRQSDIYAAGVVLWELVTGDRLFSADNEGALLAKVLEGHVKAPSSSMMPASSPPLSSGHLQAAHALDELTLRAVHPDPAQRYATAREMALALERLIAPATASEVGEWIENICAEVLHQRAELVAEIESSASMSLPRDSRAGGSLLSPTTPSFDIDTSSTIASASSPSLDRTSVEILPQPVPGDSQLSSISVAGPPPGVRRNSAIAFVIAGAVVAILVVIAGIASLRAAARAKAAHATVSAASSTPAPPSTIPDPVPLSAHVADLPNPAVAAVDPTAPSVTTSTTSQASPPAVGGTLPKPAAQKALHPAMAKPAPPPVASIPSAPPPAAAPSDCVYWDAKGIKHVNPKCL